MYIKINKPIKCRLESVYKKLDGSDEVDFVTKEFETVFRIYSMSILNNSKTIFFGY